MGGLRWLKTVSIAKASAASLLGSIFALFPFIPDVSVGNTPAKKWLFLFVQNQSRHAMPFGDHPATEDRI
jgi:hypothetical protein